ncbi:TIGR01906 family membrane protein [Arthrobacter cheniae]|uniref:TIGR01906 family membrane protein n=1 Tax=Arthrobacter cheniae TaxID=1258888 RepID=UPI001F18158D|nr:TIGR01906 family membrane protein [Arthrobacter cheniae]
MAEIDSTRPTDSGGPRLADDARQGHEPDASADRSDAPLPEHSGAAVDEPDAPLQEHSAADKPHAPFQEPDAVGDEPDALPAPSRGAVQRAGSSSGIAQRHNLPRRKASTLPDVSRVDDDESEDRADDGDVPAVAGGRAADAAPSTQALPRTPAADDGGTSPERADDDSRAGGGAHPASADTYDEPTTDTGALSVRPPDKDVARRAAVRDQAVSAKPALARFLQVVVALFFPVIVVAAAVRAVATSSFLWLEYNRPGFPADQYGFSLDDRMTYGSYALDYVLNFAPPRYLGGLVTPEGAPLFLESEVGHMADVKSVLGLSFFIALVMFVLAVIACAYLARRYKGGIRRALFSGAVLTLVGIVVLTVLAVIGWETFFTQVHALFFADGTWTFRVDDTLIRLFPEQFWTDSAVIIALLVLGATIVTILATWPTRARRERSMLAQDAAQARYREALEAS